MSQALPEGVPAPPQAPEMETGPDGYPMARYTIHVPERDNTRREIPHVLAAVRKALGQQGFRGRTVVRRAEGDWTGDDMTYSTEEMALVMIDAPRTPGVLDAMKMVAEGVKKAADQEAVYLTVQPIETYEV